MSRFRLFVENILIYGFGGIICKLIPLIMVPVITRIMPDSTYFGISDLSNTLVSFCSAFAVMGMYDAMYRMFFEREDETYKKEICSTSFVFSIITSAIVFVFMILFKEQIAIYFFADEKMSYLVYISAMATLVGATNSIIAAPTRMQNKRKTYLLMNTLNPIISYSVSIPLLLKGYYTIALPLAGLIAALLNELTFGIINKKWFNVSSFRKEHLKPLLSIAIPLFPNFIIYWIFNSSDKVMITNLLGVGEAGIYSVGSKLGHASQLIYTAFTGGWQYFAFSTMKEKDQIKSNSNIFEYLGVISFVCTFYMCTFSGIIFKILFEEEYWSAYIVAPYLFLAPLLQMLYQVACNQFLVVKKTWPNMLILFSGAVVNVILNFVLIPRIGIEGAALATLIGYIFSDIICVLVLTKMKLMIIRRRFLFVCVVAVVYFTIWRCIFVETVCISFVLALFATVLLILIYKKDIKGLKKDKGEGKNDNAK